MNACIVSGPGASPDVVEHTEALLAAHGMESWRAGRDDPTTAVASRLHKTDLIITLGGDGTFLAGGRLAAPRGIPVLGVNLGRLGFLADLRPDELRVCFPAVVRGEYRVTQHLMFECVIETPQERRTILGLNEVVFRAGPPILEAAAASPAPGPGRRRTSARA